MSNTDTENTSDAIDKLIHIVRFIFVINMILICVAAMFDLVLDLKGCDLYNTDSMVAALLPVWTFITAVIVFYMGKKDETLYGISNWNLITYSFSSDEKVQLGGILFFDLFLILLGVVIKIPVILICMFVLLVFLSAISFFLVFHCTKADVRIKQLKKMIIYDYICEKKNMNENEVGNSLKIVVKNIDFSKADDIDFLVGALILLFMQGRLAFKDGYRISYTVFDGIKEENFRKLFIKNILSRGQEDNFNKDELIEFYSCIVLPVFVFNKKNPVEEFWDSRSVISDEKERAILVSRAIAFNLYMEAYEQAKCRTLIYLKLNEKMNEYGIPKKSEEIISFYLKLIQEYNFNEYDSCYIDSVLEQYIL